MAISKVVYKSSASAQGVTWILDERISDCKPKIRVYGSTTRGSSYYISAPTLVIIES